MIDLKALRSDEELKRWYVKTRLSGEAENLEKLISLSEEQKQQQRQKEEILKMRNSNKDPEKGRLIKVDLRSIEAKLQETKAKVTEMHLQMPNAIDYSTDSRKDTLIREWGGAENRRVKYRMDMSIASKITGSNFPHLKGDMALLHRAISQYCIDYNLSAGYEEHYMPYVVNESSLISTGQLPLFEKDLFKADKFYLIPTGEVPLTNIYRDCSLPIGSTPIKMTSLTPCFRKEAGSYGKVNQGLRRQHQFNKVEIVEFVHPDHSLEALENMTKHVCDILASLNLPHRVIMLGHDEIGFTSSKTYDIEVWLPISGEYLEISSCSLCKDFQSRRMNCKMEVYEGKAYPHTLNGSALAIGRCLLAVLENYLEEGGRLLVPEVLRPYCLGRNLLSI